MGIPFSILIRMLDIVVVVVVMRRRRLPSLVDGRSLLPFLLCHFLDLGHQNDEIHDLSFENDDHVTETDCV